MKKTSILSLAGLLIFLFISLPASAADFYVYVSFFQSSPDPVQIKTGDVVYWVDGDDLGPYFITGGWGTVMTPYGIKFSVAPGYYYYTAESGWGGGSWQSLVIVNPNFPPTVKITNPTNNSVLAAPASFSFDAEPADANVNDISDVEFWIDDTFIDDVFTPPYTTMVTDLPAGTHTLKAVAWDYSNARGTNSVTISVVEPGPISLDGCSFAGGKLTFRASGLMPGKTNVLQCSTNMMDWDSVETNISDGTSLSFTNSLTGLSGFFRVMQLQ